MKEQIIAYIQGARNSSFYVPVKTLIRNIQNKFGVSYAEAKELVEIYG